MSQRSNNVIPLKLSPFSALQLPEIVFMILKYLPTSDLKMCSRVNNSVWRIEARKILVKRTCVTFTGPDLSPDNKMDEYMTLMGNDVHRSVRFGKLETSSQQRRAIAFGRNYNYGVNKITELGIVFRTNNNNNVAEMFRVFQQIKSLIVTMDGDNGDVEPGAFPSEEMVTPLEHIKSLRVKITPNISKGKRQAISTKLSNGLAKKLLLTCPSLENLSLEEEAQAPFLGLLQNSTNEQNPRTSSTKIASLGLVGTDKTFFTLRSPRLITNLPFSSLSTLEIDRFRLGDRTRATPSLWPAPWLDEILVKFAPSLRHLSLSRISCQSPMDGQKINLPKMVHLEQLEITHLFPTVPFDKEKETGWSLPSRVKITFAVGGSIVKDYGEQFPSLKVLRIKQVEEDGHVKAGTNAEVYKNARGSWDICSMFFPEGLIHPCTTLEHIDVDCASNLRHRTSNCRCGHYCFCNRRGKDYSYLERMAASFPNAVELKQFIRESGGGGIS